MIIKVEICGKRKKCKSTHFIQDHDLNGFDTPILIISKHLREMSEDIIEEVRKNRKDYLS